MRAEEAVDPKLMHRDRLYAVYSKSFAISGSPLFFIVLCSMHRAPPGTSTLPRPYSNFLFDAEFFNTPRVIARFGTGEVRRFQSHVRPCSLLDGGDERNLSDRRSHGASIRRRAAEGRGSIDSGRCTRETRFNRMQIRASPSVGRAVHAATGSEWVLHSQNSRLSR